MAKKSLLMCRCKRKGKDIGACDVLDDDERAKIVRLNEGYYLYLEIYVILLPTLQKKERSISNDTSTEDANIVYITISC